MPELEFDITGARAVSSGMTPLMAFDLAITSEPADTRIQSILLQSQVRIESTRRRYSDAERERLVELFGPPEEWGRTLQDMLWTNQSVTVPGFGGKTTVEVTLPCTFDLNVAAAKYFYGLESGDIPIIFLFTGTVFYTSGGRMLIDRISWEKECRYRMPVEEWKALIDAHYPNSGWMYLDRDVFDRLYAFKQKNGLTSWDAAVSMLLESGEKQVSPADEVAA